MDFEQYLIIVSNSSIRIIRSERVKMRILLKTDRYNIF